MSAVIAYISCKFLLSLLFSVKVWTAEDCATLQIFSGSFASITLIVLKGNLTVAHVTEHHYWSFCEYQTEVPNIAEKQHVVMISCHLLCIKDVQTLIGDVLSISFIVIMFLVGMCFFFSNAAFLCCKICDECISFF